MSKLSNIALFLGALSFALIGATGTDLVGSRTGAGLLGLGVAILLLSLFRLVKPGTEGRPWLAILSMAGGGYFVWWALATGPIGLAVPDVLLILLLLGVYLAVAASTQGMRILWISLLAALAVANVGIAIAQEMSERSLYIWQSAPINRKFIGGLFGHYNAFASFLNGSVFFFLSYLFLGRKKFLRVGSGLLSIGMVVALVLSGSRGGWLSFVIAAAIWLALLVMYLASRKSKMVGLASIALLVFGVGGVASSVMVIQKLSNKRVTQSAETTGPETDVEIGDGGRMAYQQMALETFLDAPVSGQGPRAFSYRALQKWDRDTLALWMGNPKFAHNEFLQVLADYGLIGFLILLVIIFIHVVLGVTNILKEEPGDLRLPMWQLGAAGGLVAVLCQSYFSFVYHFPACVALLALHLGILGARSDGFGKVRMRAQFSSRIVGVFGMGLAAGLLFLGGSLTKSHLLVREADQKMARATTSDQLLKGLDELGAAGRKGWDPEIFGVVARRAMSEANAAQQRKEPEVSKAFNLKAKEAFEAALELNPHEAVALSGLPRVEDALGNHAAAADGHLKAMELVWARERTLKPHLYATRSSYMRSLKAGDDREALEFMREAQTRLLKRREIMTGIGVAKVEKELAKEIAAWIASHEGRLLYLQGDDIWKKARPRNPELAYAVLLEAQKRLELAEKVLGKKEPRLEIELKQLGISLGYLKAGQVRPATLTDEQIAEMIAAEASLDSAPATR